MQVLISEKAPLEALNLSDHTALHIAAFFGHDTVCAALITAGASVHSHDKQHQTPHHLALTNLHEKVVRLLEISGVSSEVRDQVCCSVSGEAGATV